MITDSENQRPPPSRKTTRKSTVHAPTIADEIVIADFSKNRSGDSVKIVLRTYDGTNIIDIRTWHPTRDGKRNPGKGFACSLRRLPELAKAIVKAESAARDLGLLEPERAP